MYVLDSATKILTVTASAACDVTVSGFRDSTTPPSFSYQTKIGAGETKTVCPAGSAAAPRCIDNISITNTGAANTISVKQDDTGSPDVATILSSMVLAASEKGQYTHASGWDTIDANATKKSTQVGVAVASGKTLTVSETITLTAAGAGQTFTLPATSATIARTDAGQTFTGTNTFGALTLTGNVGVTGTPSFTLTGCSFTAGALVGTSLSTGSGAISGGAISGTTGGFSGTITRTGVAATGSLGLTLTGTTTAYHYATVTNTGGTTGIAVESSTGGVLVAGSAAYSTLIGSFSNTTTHIVANQAIVATFAAGGAVTIPGTTVNMTTSGTTLTVGVGADNGTVSAGVFTDRTKAFDGDAIGAIKAIKAKNGHIDHATLPAFARENVRKQTTDAEGKVTETVEVERNIGAMVSVLTVAVQELDARISKMEKP